jgi:hypothetical protein
MFFFIFDSATVLYVYEFNWSTNPTFVFCANHVMSCFVLTLPSNSVNKRQTTVTMNQIFTQKGFLFQIHFTFVMVFPITENWHSVLLPVWMNFSKFPNLSWNRYIYATRNTSMLSRASVEIRPRSQSLLWSKYIHT